MRYKKPLIFSVLSVILLVGAAFFWVTQKGFAEYRLPDKQLKFQDLRLATATSVVDSDGKTLDYWYGDVLRIYKPLGQIDPWLRQLVVFLEDAKFFSHQGLDIEEIRKSLKENLEKKKVKRGASTITQQVAKNLFLDQKRSVLRKLFEVPWSLRLEKDLSKSQILELYLNLIEWGPGIYGAEAAARHYFDRSAADLLPGQAMYLALIIPSPVRFDLLGRPASSRNLQSRKAALIDRLVNEKKVSPERGEELRETAFSLVLPSENSPRHYPLSHEGAYAGNRWKKNAWLKDIEKNLKGRGKVRNGKIQLTLSAKLQQTLNTFAEGDGPAEKDRYIALLENGQIRAFRKISKGKMLVGFDEWLAFEGVAYSSSELEKIEWSKLAL